MTLFAFEEMILELLGRNSQDFLIDGRVAGAVMQTVYGKLLQDKIHSGENVSSFYYWDIFPVQNDTRIGQKYIVPVPKVMSIGDNDGIGQVGHVFNEYDSFLLVKPSQLGQYSTLEAGKMGGRTAARPEGDRIYLLNLPPMTTELRVKYIPQLVGMPEDFELFGGSDLDLTVLDMTLQKLGFKATNQEDKENDNITNP
jgi:hypothetical protein